ncbi:MAG: flagellar biosynthetic protein FliO [Bdellovibrionales bacterium]|nr:flagellar biosynthetic protein FliO [Bdellovibrionales bacterium]
MKAAKSLPEKKTINVVKVEDLTGESEENINLADQNTVAVTTEKVESTDNKIEKTEEAKAVNIVTEEDIPVLQTLSEKDTKKSGSALFRIISSFVILGLFAFGMYLLSRRWAKTKLKNPHTHIKVLTQHYIGPKKSLAIIRVAGESILIGVTENNINLIKELSLLDDDIPQTVPDNFNVSMDEADQGLEHDERFGKEQDNFSISGIKDIVKTRLKTMRDL